MEQAGPLPLKTGTNVLSQAEAASVPFSFLRSTRDHLAVFLETPNLALESAAMLPTVRCLYAGGSLLSGRLAGPATSSYLKKRKVLVAAVCSP